MFVSDVIIAIVFLTLTAVVAWDLVSMATKRWGDHLKKDVVTWFIAVILATFVVTGGIKLLEYVFGHLSGRL